MMFESDPLKYLIPDRNALKFNWKLIFVFLLCLTNAVSYLIPCGDSYSELGSVGRKTILNKKPVLNITTQAMEFIFLLFPTCEGCL